MTEQELKPILRRLGQTGRIGLRLNRVEMDLALAACAADSRIGEAPLIYLRGVHILAFTEATATTMVEAFMNYQKSGVVPQGVTGASADLFRAAGSLLSHRIKRLLEGNGGAK